MVRRQFKDQVEVVAQGGDPIGVSFDEGQAPISLIAGNYMVNAESDLEAVPLSQTLSS